MLRIRPQASGDRFHPQANATAITAIHGQRRSESVSTAIGIAAKRSREDVPADVGRHDIGDQADDCIRGEQGAQDARTLDPVGQDESADAERKRGDQLGCGEGEAARIGEKPPEQSGRDACNRDDGRGLCDRAFTPRHADRAEDHEQEQERERARGERQADEDRKPREPATRQREQCCERKREPEPVRERRSQH